MEGKSTRRERCSALHVEDRWHGNALGSLTLRRGQGWRQLTRSISCCKSSGRLERRENPSTRRQSLRRPLRSSRCRMPIYSGGNPWSGRTIAKLTVDQGETRLSWYSFEWSPPEYRGGSIAQDTSVILLGSLTSSKKPSFHDAVGS